FILAPISIILAVISLATKRGGKGFAVAGIIISAVGIAVFSLMMSFAMKISPDIVYFENNSQAIISEFEETGEIPERYEKYRSAEYDKYWSAMGCEDFDEFFKMFINSYTSGGTRRVIPEKSEDSKESRDRETPVEL
ncbi:MAG: DUF4190 domain-containing protein, partial [Ruminococcus sp.]|nr:DUF4190 domain-containing protein [Ruminococcus sp.]